MRSTIRIARLMPYVGALLASASLPAYADMSSACLLYTSDAADE